VRLSEYQREAIKTSAAKHFGNTVRVFLFGSRVDDNKKGGDIDIYIETDLIEAIFDKKIKMLVELQKELGERKIDIVINNFKLHSTIFEVARNEGIML